MVRSIPAEAIRLPVGSNFAEKISPECPVSSITGAWRPLVRGACASLLVHALSPRDNPTYRLYQRAAPGRIGACESAFAELLALDDQLAILLVGSFLGGHRGRGLELVDVGSKLPESLLWWCRQA